MIGAYAMPSSLVLFATLLGIAAVTDVAWLRIPNWITLSLAALFPVAACAASHPASWWLSHLAAGTIVLICGLGLFAWGKIGGGDAKLMGAIGLWSGLQLLPSLLLVIGVINGAVILIWLASRRYGVGAYLEAYGWRLTSMEQGRDMPFAVAAAAGCWLFLRDFLV